jgi:Protein of unknown function (DUF2844)
LRQLFKLRQPPEGFSLKGTRMPRFRLTGWMLPSLAASAALLPGLACATLGEPEASVLTDAAQLQGSVKHSNLGGYRQHEIQLSSGTVVRQYAGLDGRVFAITWHGPYMPNLKLILGRYFDAYVAAEKAPHADHHHLKVQQGDLMVESSGHMRAFNGRAWLPSAIPAGLSVGDLP